MIVYPVLNALIAISSVFRLEIDLADIMQEFCCALLIEAVVPALANVLKCSGDARLPLRGLPSPRCRGRKVKAGKAVAPTTRERREVLSAKTGAGPALALCRKLMDAGFDARRPCIVIAATLSA